MPVFGGDIYTHTHKYIYTHVIHVLVGHVIIHVLSVYGSLIPPTSHNHRLNVSVYTYTYAYTNTNYIPLYITMFDRIPWIPLVLTKTNAYMLRVHTSSVALF